MEVRRARPDDLAGVRAIAASYGTLEGWPQRPDHLDFELEQDGLWVALDGDGVAGFAGVADHGARVHLADLFVRRDAVGAGIGRALLAAALPRSRPCTTLAALSDPRAPALYARAGLIPLAPVLYLEGVVTGGGDTRPAAPGGAGDPRPAAPADVAAPAVAAFLERAGAYALAAGGSRALIRPAGDGARLGPADADAGGLMRLAAAACAVHGRVSLALPGPHPALEPLLGAGMRLTDTDAFMASSPQLVNLERAAFEADLG